MSSLFPFPSIPKKKESLCFTSNHHQTDKVKLYISPFVNTLCLRYPLVHFYKARPHVDVDESLALAKAESIKKVPTFKVYKEGDKVKEMVCPRLLVTSYLRTQLHISSYKTSFFSFFF
ncbi:hypothetical protein YC2023_052148 [Brassica napus]|nr:unnamed protein product [Brassica napus]